MDTKALQALQHLRQTLQDAQAAAAARERADAEAHRLAAWAEAAAREAQERERRRFADTVGPVHTVPQQGRAPLPRPAPRPEPHQRQADDRQALAESLLSGVDASTLLLTDDGLSFHRPEVPADVLAGCAVGIGRFRPRSTCMATAAKKRARRWLPSFARRGARASAACVWCTARAGARRAASRCSRAACGAGWCTTPT
jgi:hypothetical protein